MVEVGSCFLVSKIPLKQLLLINPRPVSYELALYMETGEVSFRV